MKNKFLFNTFITNEQLDKLSQWTYKVQDNGIMSYYLMPLYNYLPQFIPRAISPNVLSFTGLLMSMYAWYLSYNENTFINNFFVGSFIFIYMVIDAIDGKHARNTNTSSSLGELVDHFCDCITNVLLTVSICNIYDINDTGIRYILIYITQQVFFIEHLYAYQSKKLVFNKYTGPTEVICGTIGLIWLKSFIEIFINLNSFVNYICILIIIYFGITLIIATIKLYKIIDYQTVLIYILCNIIQIIKIIMNDTDYINNGMILSLLSADIIIGKMAERPLHPFIAIIHMITLFNSNFSIPLVLTYFLINIWDISNYTDVPILNIQTNIFVCGYYDCLHVGHIESLKNASLLGTNLIVGIHSQTDLIEKLRKKNQTPYEDNEIIRYFKVKQLPFVTKIIKGCSSTELTEDFINKHKIHIIGMSDEYIEEIDENNNIIKVLPYYQIALNMGILRIIPRTTGISSTDLRN